MSSFISRCSRVARTLERNGGHFALGKLSQKEVPAYQFSFARFANSSNSNASTSKNATVESSVGVGDSSTVQVSENCAKRLVELTRNGKDQFLRVSVEGGGCSGFQYKFEIDSKPQPDDKTFTNPKYESALVVVDSTSLEYLKGSTVDFHVELIRSAFRVISNPKAEHGCSCGASFTVKID